MWAPTGSGFPDISGKTVCLLSSFGNNCLEIIIWKFLDNYRIYCTIEAYLKKKLLNI